MVRGFAIPDFAIMFSMIKFLNGQELAGFIKQRQAAQVRGLRQASKIFPKLAIIQTIDDPVVNTYVRLKCEYADDIGVAVDVHKIAQDEVPSKVAELNSDSSVHGIIIQLPLQDPSDTDDILNLVNPDKDVDGLGGGAKYDPATAVAINWLLTGYNIELLGKKITIIGNGRLVGAPLARMWRNSGLDVTVLDSSTTDVKSTAIRSDLLVSATGVPGIITGDMIQPGAVVVDAGTTSDSGHIVGDVAEEVYERDDITITPHRGGVGPLTIAALMDNVLRVARG